MLRSLLLSILLLLQCWLVLAQEPVRVDFDYANRKVIFSPLIQQLTKDNRYALVMPKSLTYYTSESDIKMNIYSGMYSYSSLKAKLDMTTPDYTFEISHKL